MSSLPCAICDRRAVTTVEVVIGPVTVLRRHVCALHAIEVRTEHIRPAEQAPGKPEEKR